MRRPEIASRLGQGSRAQAVAATDQALRFAICDPDLMRRIRLACADALRVDLLSDHQLVAYYLKLQDGTRPFAGFEGFGAPSAFHARLPAQAAQHHAVASHAAQHPAAKDAITQKQLKQIFPRAADDYLDRVARDLNRDLPRYKLDSRLRRAHFFAQLREESGPGLEATVENLSYSPEGLKLFHYYKIHKDEAVEDGYERDPKTRRITRAADQEEIANKAYAGRNGNGSIESEDGWTFRGRGLIQVTGRGNYAQITRQYAVLYVEESGNTAHYISFVAKPDLVCEFPYSLRSAVCYWTQHKLHLLADKGHADDDVDRITRVINSATKSYKARCEHFKAAYSAFG
ncbi:glycoside hydrolase family 19 protein [Methylobacterium dankookense]|uniref:Glycoside hydrolase family 19 catalytic domain-containing protein n=1 Tax=Methylobacterium dankookense TaxID=560405 RepID=A0A564FWH6_9HYPH|nr:hypothetical protein [Methylobacterium dankookense]GJD56197.1 hypothetical protein IFDJLNFL_2092 [Methylobacterium dankookense]VUF11771.1 hypothetical protein MTDSW087_01455 [Methylobacterium dankookense]